MSDEPYWNREPQRMPVSADMNAVFDSFREKVNFPAPETVEVEPLDGSTDESLTDILVDAVAIPVTAGCCEGGKCQPKPETRVYQAKCEDAAHPQTTHFERLEAMPIRAGLLCEQAAKLIGGPRQEAYGDVRANWERIGILWEALECVKATLPDGHVDAKLDVWARNVLQKMARILLTPKHTDSYRDIIGYTDLQAVVAGCDPSK